MADDQTALADEQAGKLGDSPPSNHANVIGEGSAAVLHSAGQNAVAPDKKSKKRSKQPEKSGGRGGHRSQQQASISVPAASSSSSSTNNDSSGGGSGNSAEASSDRTTTTTSSEARKHISSRVRWHEQRGKILGQFHLMNPVQRIELVHDILLNLYPAERLWVEKVMEDVRQTDAQYFMDFGGHSNDKNTSILKDYLRFGDARAVLVHEGMRKSLIMDIAFLKATSFYNADAFHKLLMDAALDSVCFMPDQLETLMQLMLLYRFCSRHPAFRIQQRFDCERVFRALEHQYYTYCDGGSFLQAAGIEHADVVSSSSSVHQPKQQQQFSMPNGVDASTQLLDAAALSAGSNDTAAETAKFQQALNRQLEYMYSLDPTTFPPENLASHIAYAAGVAGGDTAGYNNTGHLNNFAPEAAAAGGGMSLQRLKSASLNDMTTQLQCAASDQPFATADSSGQPDFPFFVSSQGNSQQHRTNDAVPSTGIGQPSSSKTSAALTSSSSSTAFSNSKAVQQPSTNFSTSRWTADGPTVSQGNASTDSEVTNERAKHTHVGKNNNSGSSARADISLPKTFNTATVTTTTSLSSTVTTPFAKLVPNTAAAFQHPQQHASNMHAHQTGGKPTVMLTDVAEVGRMGQQMPQRPPALGSYAVQPNYAVDPIVLYNKPGGGVSLESGTQLGLNDDDEHTQFFVNSSSAMPSNQQQQFPPQYHNFQYHARFFPHQPQQQQQQQFYRSSGAAAMRPQMQSTSRNSKQHQQQLFPSHFQRVDNAAAAMILGSGGGVNDASFDHSQQQQLEMPLVNNDGNVPFGIFFANTATGEVVPITTDAVNAAGAYHHFRVNSSEVFAPAKSNASHYVGSDDGTVPTNAHYPVHHHHHHQQQQASHAYSNATKHPSQNNDVTVYPTTYQQQQPDVGLMPQHHSNPTGNVQMHASPHHFYASSQHHTGATTDEQQQQQQQQFLADPYGNYSPFIANLIQQSQSPIMASTTTTTTVISRPTMSKAGGMQQQQVVTINPEALQYNVAVPLQQQQQRFQAPLQQLQHERQVYATGNFNQASFTPQHQVAAHYQQQQQQHAGSAHAPTAKRSQQPQQPQQNYYNSAGTAQHPQRSNVTSPSNAAIRLSPENIAELQKHFVLLNANSPQQVINVPSQQQQQYRSLDAHMSPELGLSMQQQQPNNSATGSNVGATGGHDYANVVFENSALQQNVFRPPAPVTQHRNPPVNSSSNMPHSSSSGRLTSLVNNSNASGYAAPTSAAGVLFQQQPPSHRFPPPPQQQQQQQALTLQQQHAHENLAAADQRHANKNDTSSNNAMLIRAQHNVNEAVANSGAASRTNSARSSPAKTSSLSSVSSSSGTSHSGVSGTRAPPFVTAEPPRHNPTTTARTTATSPPIVSSPVQQQQQLRPQFTHITSSASRVAESSNNTDGQGPSASTTGSMQLSFSDNNTAADQPYRPRNNSGRNTSGGSLNTNWRAIPQEQPVFSTQQQPLQHQRGDQSPWGNNSSAQSATAFSSVSPPMQSLNYAGAAAAGGSGNAGKQQHTTAAAPLQKKSSSRNSTADSHTSSSSVQQQPRGASATAPSVITSPPLQHVFHNTAASNEVALNSTLAANLPHSASAANSLRPTGAGVHLDYSMCNGQTKSTSSSPPLVASINSAVMPHMLRQQRRKSTSPPTTNTNTSSTANLGHSGQSRLPLTYAAASSALPSSSTLTSSKSSSLLQTSSTAADSNARPIVRNR